MKKIKIPQSLRNWFTIHFIVDLVFGLPLFIVPREFLMIFGIQAEPFTARLLGAAILGIGFSSYFMITEIKEFKLALKRKILWSSAAIIGILITILEGGSSIGWVLIIIFVIFFIIWTYYNKILE